MAVMTESLPVAAEATDRNPDVTGRRATPATREEGRWAVPAVDIYEDDDQLVLVAEVPGSRKDDVDVRLDGGVLTLEARTSRPAVEGQALWTEFRPTHYHRSFELIEDVDVERITADLRHGVLTVRLPKAERLKARKVDVRVAP